MTWSVERGAWSVERERLASKRPPQDREHPTHVVGNLEKSVELVLREVRSSFADQQESFEFL